MSTPVTDSNLPAVRVLFEDGPGLTVPAVWQVRFATERQPTINFLRDPDYIASIVVLAGERVHLDARRTSPNSRWYYAITLADTEEAR